MINAVSYQFERFVEFAEERVEAGKGSAIANEDGDDCENGEIEADGKGSDLMIKA